MLKQSINKANVIKINNLNVWVINLLMFEAWK